MKKASALAAPAKPYPPLSHPDFRFETHFSSSELAWLETAFGDKGEYRTKHFKEICEILSNCEAFQDRMKAFIARTSFMNQVPKERAWLINYTYHLIGLMYHLKLELFSFMKETGTRPSLYWCKNLFDLCIGYWTPLLAYRNHHFKYAGKGEDLHPLWKYNNYLAVDLLNFLLTKLTTLDQDLPIGEKIPFTVFTEEGEVSHSETADLFDEAERDRFFLFMAPQTHFVYEVHPRLKSRKVRSHEENSNTSSFRAFLKKHQVWDGKHLLNPASG